MIEPISGVFERVEDGSQSFGPVTFDENTESTVVNGALARHFALRDGEPVFVLSGLNGYNFTGIVSNGLPVSLLRGSLNLSGVTAGKDNTFTEPIKFDYAVLGSHAQYSEPKFTAFSFSFDSLHSFTTHNQDLDHLPHGEELTKEVLEFDLHRGYRVTLATRVALKLEAFKSRTYERSVRFKASGDQLLSLEGILIDFINPIRDLLSILYSSRLNLSSVTVQCEDGTWCIVYGQGITSFSSADKKPFITAEELDPTIFTKWVANRSVNTHSKHILIATLANDFKFLDVSLSVLITEAEKLQKQISNNYSEKTGYRDRVLDLSNRSILGSLLLDDSKDLWSRRVKSHRSHFIHRRQELSNDSRTQLEFKALHDSLAWIILGALFRSMQVSKISIRTLAASKEFQMTKTLLQSILGYGGVPMDEGLELELPPFEPVRFSVNNLSSP